MPNTNPFRQYISSIRANLKQGDATEHTHRPALKTLLESALHGITATNEPKRIECGAPDFAISANALTIGYIEAKDCHISLDALERDSRLKNPGSPNGKQLKRYRHALPNLILTNYTEFRWYVDGERRSIAKLADDDGSGNLTANIANIAETAELLSAFIDRRPEPVVNPQDLARRMARLTHMIRDVVQEAFNNDQASMDVKDLYEATQKALVADLSLEDFADMFAQTLAYGLFASRVNHSAGDFHRRTAVHDIPAANPFLREIFNLVVGLNAENEPFIGFVDDLAQLLANSDIQAILADFGKRGALQDPIMHFYETFLTAYDPNLRDRRGVYYTPEPVISYIVRSVDLLLRERFGCPEGLADYQMAEYQTMEQVDGEQKPVTKQAHRVLILDPACGTGSFLYAVIDHIRETYRRGGNLGMWNGYVRQHLLKRIFGFELMMAPYAMSHLKLAMQLAAQDMPEERRADWAYHFNPDERLGVYLTNSLEQAEQQIPNLFGPMRVITEEANAASKIKRELPIMVVLGNPPYSLMSSNKSEWITKLIDDYKVIDGKPLGERKNNLQNDYVKFIRFGQWRIQQSATGILAFITGHGYLDGPTFRGMRQQLMDTFTDIYLLDLHGNANKKEHAPDGSSDQNVFDIRQGVAIALFVKEADKNGPAKVHHADLWGTRDLKYETLEALDITTTDWEQLEPISPNYLFKPWNNELAAEYEQWQKIDEVIPVNSVGITTARDKLTIHWSHDEVMQVVRDFSSLSAEKARDKYNLWDTQGWKVHQAQDDLKNKGTEESLVEPILYRPFDTRHTYYTGTSNGFISRPLYSVMRHMLPEDNWGLIATRQTRDLWSVLATDSLIAHKAMAAYDRNSIFPLYIYPTEQEIEQGLYPPDHRDPNLSPAFTADMERRLKLQFIPDGKGDLDKNFGPEDVFHYIYAIFHAPAYRQRYDQFLRADFPRVPLTDDTDLFRALVRLGAELTAIHLLKSPNLNGAQFAFPVRGDNIVEKAHPKYYAPGETPTGARAPIKRGRVYISKSNRKTGKQGQYFDSIPPDTWASRIGGYQPLDKWLKDRKGRTLTFNDINHYKQIAAALQQTTRLTAQISAATTWLNPSTGDTPGAKPPFRVKPNHSGFTKEIDPLHLNRLLDELETEDFLTKNPE